MDHTADDTQANPVIDNLIAEDLPDEVGAVDDGDIDTEALLSALPSCLVVS